MRQQCHARRVSTVEGVVLTAMQTPPPSPISARIAATQESHLYDYLQRLERHRRDRRAVHIHLSSLAAINRREHHLRTALNAFDGLVKMLNAQVFSLTNEDMIVVYKASAQDEIEGAIVKLRFLFADDPLIRDEAVGPPLCTWYSLDQEYEQVLALVQQMVQEEETRMRAAEEKTALAQRAAAPKGQPFTPAILVRTEAALAQADIANMLRRQPICALVGQAPAQPVFYELFVAISELRQSLCPTINLSSAPWLFQELTETLDRRVLSLLTKHDDSTLERDISLNLNVSTILSPEFLVFDDNVKAGMRGTIVLELQKVDIFADLGAYLFARDFARERGYRVCIDGLTHSMLPFVDRERLGADLIKLIWDPSLVEEMDMKSRALKRIGVSRIILCRCDTPTSVEYGHSVGITLFQGRHIDGILANDVRRHGRSRR
jgi:hypothetical protein